MRVSSSAWSKSWGRISNIRELRNIATHCCLLSGNGLIDEAQTEELLSSAPARHPSPVTGEYHLCSDEGQAGSLNTESDIQDECVPQVKFEACKITIPFSNKKFNIYPINIQSNFSPIKITKQKHELFIFKNNSI